MLRAGVTSIGTVRATTRDPDRFGVELRLSSLLSGADLEPVGLAPSAIVCIRLITAPRPRGARSEWSAEVRKSIEDSIRAAVRPAERQPPPSSRAVIFVNAAEMLACMLADAASGTLAHRWWWRSLLGGAWLTAEVVSRRWSENPTCVPAAVEYLVRGGTTAALTALESPFLVLRSVVRAFGLTHLEEAVVTPAESSGRVSLSAPMTADVGATGGTAAPAQKVAMAPPWRRWVPPRLEAGLTLDQRTLLGISVVIFRGPEVARQVAFAEAVATWQSAGADVAAGDHADDRSQQNEVTPVQHTLPSGTTVVAVTPFRRSELTTDTEPEAASEPPRRADLDGQPLRGASAGAERSVGAADAVEVVTGEEVAAEATVAPLDELVADTEFGGLFYLLNVAVRLGFYPDFTRPADPSIPFGAWDFLAAVGQRLLGDELRADSIWKLIITLGGREESEHPLADLDTDLVADLTDRVQGYLVDGLGLTVDLVCRASGRAVASATNVDVLLKLEDLPIQIRRFGLDRDLGWLPAAGRFIAFHFS